MRGVWLIWLVLSAPPLLGQQVLTLQDVLRTVEQTHPALRAASYEPELAEAEIRNALGRFDPDLQLTYEYKDKSGADKVNYLDGSLELPLNMLFGPKLKAEYRRGIGFQLDPENRTATAGEASLGVSLPLFQGIFTDRRRTQLQKSLQRPEAARAQYRIERNNLLRTAARLYWSWALAHAEREVIDTMVVLAERRMVQIARLALIGERPMIDSVEIAQEVQRRRGQQFDALRKLEQARNALSFMVWGADGQPLALQGSPEELPRESTTTIDIQAAEEQAQQQRPEVARLRVLQSLARLDSALAQEFLRPYVELEAAITSYDANQLGSADYKMGVRVSQPLLFRSALAGAQVASIGVQRADLSEIIIRRSVSIDASNAVVALQRARQRVDAAEVEVQLAQRMLAAELRLLSAGESTLLQVNLRERFLAEALLRIAAARADQAIAEIDVRWATGQL